MYLNTEWDGSKTASGVMVSDGTHAFVIHPNAEQENTKWSSNTSFAIPGVITTEDDATAEKDFAGEANTEAILAAIANDAIADAPAAQYCAGITFAHGKTGYLPSAGELALAYTYIDDINASMTAIGGILLDMNTNYYWSSTQIDEYHAWNWSGNVVFFNCKSNKCPVRAISAL